jgi:large subunit ribosomal protein L15
MKLNKLPKNKTKSAKIVGRGYGSGKGGHTVGRGQKGQRSRSGFKKQKSWVRESKIKSIPKLKGIGKRSAKRGYIKAKTKSYIFNVCDLNRFENGEVVNLEVLRSRGLIKSKSKRITIKILGNGELKKSIIVQNLDVSKSAKKKIEDAKGKVI